MRVGSCFLIGLMACTPAAPRDEGVVDPSRESQGSGTIVGNPGDGMTTAARTAFRIAPTRLAPASRIRMHLTGVKLTTCEGTVHERPLDVTVDASQERSWPLTPGKWCSLDLYVQPPVVVRQPAVTGFALDAELDVDGIHLESEDGFGLYSGDAYVLELGQPQWLDVIREVATDGGAVVRPGDAVHDRIAHALSNGSALFEQGADDAVLGERTEDALARGETRAEPRQLSVDDTGF
jgi:hypothetical protein